MAGFADVFSGGRNPFLGALQGVLGAPPTPGLVQTSPGGGRGPSGAPSAPAGGSVVVGGPAAAPGGTVTAPSGPRKTPTTDPNYNPIDLGFNGLGNDALGVAGTIAGAFGVPGAGIPGMLVNGWNTAEYDEALAATKQPTLSWTDALLSAIFGIGKASGVTGPSTKDKVDAQKTARTTPMPTGGSANAGMGGDRKASGQSKPSKG